MAKYHINSKDVPSPCRAVKGNCPFGGDSGSENHYNSIEEAQAAADKINRSEFGILPSESTLKPAIRNSISDVDSSIEKNGSHELSYEIDGFENEPLAIDGSISKIDDNTYEFNGVEKTPTMVEEDFDEPEEYEEYMEDPEYYEEEISFKFTRKEFEDELSDESVHGNSDPSNSERIGAAMYEFYKQKGE